MRKLTLEAKITVFKSLVISKIVYLALLTKIPNYLKKCFYGETKSNMILYVTNIKIVMIAAPPLPFNFRGDLKICDQNNWGGGGGGET